MLSLKKIAGLPLQGQCEEHQRTLALLREEIKTLKKRLSSTQTSPLDCDDVKSGQDKGQCHNLSKEPSNNVPDLTYTNVPD